MEDLRKRMKEEHKEEKGNKREKKWIKTEDNSKLNKNFSHPSFFLIKNEEFENM